MHTSMIAISQIFFARPAPEVAPDLLGMRLVHESPSGERLSGCIVETEAYAQDDPAWYGWRILDVATGLVQPVGRGMALFGPPGTAYIHLCYGVHWMLNVVTEPGRAGCVLIRAVAPLEGQGAMWRRQKAARREHELANGPGRLTQAFDIDRRFHEMPLTAPPLYLTRPQHRTSRQIVRSTRIGVRHGSELPYRFFLDGHPAVSRRPLGHR